ncbi:hypothetical protein RHECNPAF_570022 [Rhizobium etli CNPAF512]|nr:hypothetical protein RHECNPAF_570022 [Rhizobium etli CNPAF512]
METTRVLRRLMTWAKSETPTGGRCSTPASRDVKRPLDFSKGLLAQAMWMVGVTGIEPVTPTMST